MSNEVVFKFLADESALTKSIDDARNKISAVADSMNEIVSAANTQLKNVTEQFDSMSTNADKASSSSSSLGESIGSIGSKIAGVLAAVVAVKKLIDCVQWLYSVTTTQADAEAKLEQSLKTTGNAAGYSANQIKQFAAGRQEVTKFGDEATIAAASIASAFTNLHGEAFLKTIELSQDLATALGTDLNSATKSLATALNEPVKGMEQLRSMGVTLSASQKQLVKDLAETGKVTEAQQILLDAVSKSYGGAAEGAAQTFSGALQQIQNRIGDIGEIIGGAFGKLSTAIMPFLDDFVSMLESSVVPAFEYFGEVIEGLEGPVTAVLNTIYDAFTNTFTVWIETIERVYSQIADTLIPVFSEMGISGEGLISVLDNVATFFQNVFGTALTVIGDIVTGVIIPAFGSLVKGVQSAMDALVPIVKPVVSVLSDAFIGLVKVIESVGNAIGYVFGNDLMGTELIQSAKDAAAYVKDAFNEVSSNNQNKNEQRQVERENPKQKQAFERPQITFDSKIDTTDKKAEKEAERLKKLQEKYAVDLSKFNSESENKLNDLRTKHLIQNKNAEKKSVEEQDAIVKQQMIEEKSLIEEQAILKNALQEEFEAKRRNASDLELQEIRNNAAKALSELKNDSSVAMDVNKYDKPEKKEKEKESRVGNIEGIEETYKRISQAMNQKEPEDEAAKQVEKLAQQEKESMEKQNSILENVNNGVGGLLNPLNQMLQKLDGIGGLT